MAKKKGNCGPLTESASPSSALQIPGVLDLHLLRKGWPPTKLQEMSCDPAPSRGCSATAHRSRGGGGGNGANHPHAAAAPRRSHPQQSRRRWPLGHLRHRSPSISRWRRRRRERRTPLALLQRHIYLARSSTAGGHFNTSIISFDCAIALIDK